MGGWVGSDMLVQVNANGVGCIVVDAGCCGFAGPAGVVNSRREVWSTYCCWRRKMSGDICPREPGWTVWDLYSFQCLLYKHFTPF